jgi:signal transduction histidine kinase
MSDLTHGMRFASKIIPQARLVRTYLLVGLFLTISTVADGAILWKHTGTVLACNNTNGEDILNGAVKPRYSNSSDVLYFKFTIDPISDTPQETVYPYMAGLVLYLGTEDHLGVGNSWKGWAYSAFNVSGQNSEAITDTYPETTGPARYYVDLHSASAQMYVPYEYVVRFTPRTIVFKVQYIPNQDALITVWLNPDLSGATEGQQSTGLVTQFRADATFNQIHLIHRGRGDGWKFRDIEIATSFEDFSRPKFWRQWWFMLSVVCGIFLIVLAAIRVSAQRQIQLLKLEQSVAAERARIARDLHDDLGSLVTRLVLLNELTLQNRVSPEEAKEHARKISDTTRQMIQSLDETVWAINPRNDALPHLLNYLGQFAIEFLKLSNLRCRIDFPSQIPARTVSAEARHNLFLALKEALNNTIRHAQATEIWLSAVISADALTITLEDNGRGFAQAPDNSTADGLRNMQQRMQEIGGRFKVESMVGKGTKVILIFLWNTPAEMKRIRQPNP